MSDVTLQLTVQSKSRAFVIGMCYRLRLGKLLCEKCALTIAMKYALKKKKNWIMSQYLLALGILHSDPTLIKKLIQKPESSGEQLWSCSCLNDWPGEAAWVKSSHHQESRSWCETSTLNLWNHLTAPFSGMLLRKRRGKLKQTHVEERVWDRLYFWAVRDLDCVDWSPLAVVHPTWVARC